MELAQPLGEGLRRARRRVLRAEGSWLHRALLRRAHRRRWSLGIDFAVNSVGAFQSLEAERRSASCKVQWSLYLGVAIEWAININLRRVRMSESSQIALIRKLYGARGN